MPARLGPATKAISISTASSVLACGSCEAETTDTSSARYPPDSAADDTPCAAARPDSTPRGAPATTAAAWAPWTAAVSKAALRSP
ncbi:MAG: hypothetical protein M3415_05465, partial [Actinomycetota bacterium]|nr:hypothetical protein [Actinomycetota bacterium]